MTIPAWYGATAAAFGLLALGGAMKAVKPNETANALKALGLPAARVLVRVGGAVEALVGVAAVIIGGWVTAMLVGASYTAFALFVLAAMRSRTPISSCGCFGEVDAPPTRLHVVVNVAAAAAALLSATTNRAPGIATVITNAGWSALPLIGLAVLAGYLAFLVMAVLPRTLAVTRGDA